MKLSTDIKPRANGTLSVKGEDGKDHLFQGDPLECDITDKPTLKRLLLLGTFFPASEDDEAEALELINAAKPPKTGRARKPLKAAVQTEPDGDGDGDDDDDGEDEPVNLNALPIEANTPPKDGAAPVPEQQVRRARKQS